MTENGPPYRVAIRTLSATASSDEGRASIWLRLERPQAYRLIELLQSQLESAGTMGAERIIKTTILKAPINGGINNSSGNMALLFEGESGLQHRFELPFDQSGAMLEILDRAAKTGAEWADKQLTHAPGAVERVHLEPREAESMLLGEDPDTGRPILSVRLPGGHQFSFLLDRKIVEQIRVRRSRPKLRPSQSISPYISVANDIEWFRNEWCVIYEPPSDDELLRGTAALRNLLVNDAIGNAWRDNGFQGQPRLEGPDVEALASQRGLNLRHATSLIAGGGCVNGISAAMIGAVRVFNPATGKGPDDDEGFAVEVISTLRDARAPETASNELTHLVHKSWTLNDYLESISAVRRGLTISHREIIKYFAIYCGGVHLEKVKKTPRKDTERYEFINELENAVTVDTMDGLYFELLSIGQTIGRSSDLWKLVTRIREGAR